MIKFNSIEDRALSEHTGSALLSKKANGKYSIFLPVEETGENGSTPNLLDKTAIGNRQATGVEGRQENPQKTIPFFLHRDNLNAIEEVEGQVVDFLRPGIGKGAINADVETVSDYPIETVRQWHYYNAKNIEKQFNHPDDYFKTNVGYSVVEFLDVVLARCYDDEGTLRSLSMFDESNPHDLFAQKRTADFMQTLDFDVVEREFKAFLSSEGVNPVAKNAKGESTYSYGTLREEFKEYIKYLMG